MRPVTRRIPRRSEDGFALVMALIVISVIAVLVAAVSQYAFVSEANTTSTGSLNKTVYTADGQADGAVRAMMTNPYLGIAPYNSACFSSTELLNGLAATLNCRARSGSGAVTPSATLNAQPAAAVTALGGLGSSDGVTQAAGKSALVQGDIASANTVTQGAGATLTTRGSVTGAAAACTTSGTATPPIVCPATAPADPKSSGTYGASWNGPTAYPVFRTLSWVGSATPTCPTATVVPIQAGTYTDSTLFQFLFNCTGKIIWFQPGIYYFQFATASELIFNSTTSVIVAGTALGCVPSPCGATQVPSTWTAPGNVLFPIGATPTDQSACDQTQTGVEFVLGGSTRLTVNSGKVQLCSYLPSGNTTAQHIAVYGYPSDTQVGTATATATTVTTVANPSAGNRGWTTTNNAIVVDNLSADVKVPQVGDSSEFIEVGGFATTSFPTTGTVPITATVTATASGTGEFHALLVYGPAASPTLLTDTVLLTCGTTPNDPRCSSAGVMSNFNFVTSVPASALSTLRVRTYVFNYNNAPVSAFFDGATLTAPTIFAATAPPVSTPGYTAGGAALIKVNGAYPSTNFSIHGTVYAPNAPLEFNSSGVPYTMVDRGVVVRHLNLSTTSVASATPYPIISIPLLPRAPRRVLLTSTVAGVVQLLADVTFTNVSTPTPVGTVNGSYAHVTQWSHQR